MGSCYVVLYMYWLSRQFQEDNSTSADDTSVLSLASLVFSVVGPFAVARYTLTSGVLSSPFFGDGRCAAHAMGFSVMFVADRLAYENAKLVQIVKLIRWCTKSNIPWTFEHPASSCLWKVPMLKQCFKKAKEIEEKGLAALQDYARGRARRRFELKDPQAYQNYFVNVPLKHSAVGRAKTLRGFQATRPVWYEQEEDLRGLQVPKCSIIQTGAVLEVVFLDPVVGQQ